MNIPTPDPTVRLTPADLGWLAGEFIVCVDALSYEQYTIYHICTGIVLIAGVLLLLVAVTGMVVLMFVICKRKHPNKQGNSCCHNKGGCHDQVVRI